MKPINTSRIWRNVACLTATLLIGWYGWAYKVDAWLLLVYLSTVGGFEWISAMIKQRFGGVPSELVPRENSAAIAEKKPFTNETPS